MAFIQNVTTYKKKVWIIWSSRPRYWYYNTGTQYRYLEILVSQYLPKFSSICNTRRYWSLPKYEYCRYWKILENTGNTSIADTGKFWKILVIPVLQILENTGYTSIADTGRLGMKLRCVPVQWQSVHGRHTSHHTCQNAASTRWQPHPWHVWWRCTVHPWSAAGRLQPTCNKVKTLIS